jgi:hypothetical protein
MNRTGDPMQCPNLLGPSVVLGSVLFHILCPSNTQYFHFTLLKTELLQLSILELFPYN